MVASKDDLPDSTFPPPNRKRRTHIEEVVQQKGELDKRDLEETKLSQQQVACINHWDKLLKRLPEDRIPNLPSFPIWGDELGATYPYEDKTPLLLTKKELISHLAPRMHLNGRGRLKRIRKGELLALFPSYANWDSEFPRWKTRFIKQNRDWFAGCRGTDVDS